MNKVRAPPSSCRLTTYAPGSLGKGVTKYRVTRRGIYVCRRRLSVLRLTQLPSDNSSATNKNRFFPTRVHFPRSFLRSLHRRDYVPRDNNARRRNRRVVFAAHTVRTRYTRRHTIVSDNRNRYRSFFAAVVHGRAPLYRFVLEHSNIRNAKRKSGLNVTYTRFVGNLRRDICENEQIRP